MESVICLETNRMILRTVSMADIESVASNWKLDKEPIPAPDAKKEIERMLANHKKNVPTKIIHLCLAIILKETKAFIGWCGLDHTNDKDAEGGYSFTLSRDNYFTAIGIEI